MFLNVLLSSLIILTYTNSLNAALMDDIEQFGIYVRILLEEPTVPKFCKIDSQLWASYCTMAIEDIAKESEEYDQIYLDYHAFTTNEPNSEKCQHTRLFLPFINAYVNLEHLICHGRPIIIRTDKFYENKFRDKISIYITDNYDLLIIEKINERSHKLLKFISANMSPITPISGVLTIPSPESTFDIKTLNWTNTDNILLYHEHENHILTNINNHNFKSICYMIFSRWEYKNKVKLLPKTDIQVINKPVYKSKCYLWLSSIMKFKVTMFTCFIFEKKFELFKLIAGPNPNSVVVVKFEKNRSRGRPYELIKNISIEHLNIQVRI